MNADTTTSIGDKVNIVATRDIQAGETIYISHNLCEECQYRHRGYGTAGTIRINLHYVYELDWIAITLQHIGQYHLLFYGCDTMTCMATIAQ